MLVQTQAYDANLDSPPPKPWARFPHIWEVLTRSGRYTIRRTLRVTSDEKAHVVTLNS
jgi:hypothetical protein